MLRFYLPDKGEVLINSVPVNCYGKQYSDKVSVVFQQPYFMPLSIKENLVFDKEYNQLDIENADIIYVLDKGNIVAKGTYEELMNESSVYKELYAFQQVG